MSELTLCEDELPSAPVYAAYPVPAAEGLQVTLAKRIVRPGSNKVIMLAAQTSVPFSDDELASVSDLGLRLSDGTNVVLSVSSFHDKARLTQERHRHDYIPYNRVYEPERYEPSRFDAPRSSMVPSLFIVLLAVSAFCVVRIDQPKAHTPSLARAKAGGVSSQRKPAEAVKQAPVIAGVPKVSSSKVPAAKPSQQKPPSRSKTVTKTTAVTARVNSNPKNMFIPPPPPDMPSFLSTGELVMPSDVVIHRANKPEVTLSTAKNNVRSSATKPETTTPAAVRTEVMRPAATTDLASGDVYLERIKFPE